MADISEKEIKSYVTIMGYMLKGYIKKPTKSSILIKVLDWEVENAWKPEKVNVISLASSQSKDLRELKTLLTLCIAAINAFNERANNLLKKDVSDKTKDYLKSEVERHSTEINSLTVALIQVKNIINQANIHLKGDLDVRRNYYEIIIHKISNIMLDDLIKILDKHIKVAKSF
ncbi:hypothetical protein K9L67_05835 [Candidatus Woesearchaeota archaeon]|nr:hypothetical protein [Candidatus Woesearchaeota archaeon]MCF8013852.1 hypothetical protein [Candidatus Woesearchaeota archaeon]